MIEPHAIIPSFKMPNPDFTTLDSIFETFENTIFKEIRESRNKIQSDVYMDEKTILVKFLLPDVKKEDISLSMENHSDGIQIVLKAERKETTGLKKIYSEIAYGQITSVVKIQEKLELKEGEYSTQFENGVLILKINKTNKEQSKITVKLD